ncbi:MAG: hypothetical protein PHR28_02085 [candidate division Zixibacteria bacterium]|nr:hypothetical protein [candidate division Zixibacteria bacterium]
MATRAKMTKKTFWAFASIGVIMGFAMGLAYDAPIIVSVAIGVVGGLAIIVVGRLLNRKKATA